MWEIVLNFVVFLENLNFTYQTIETYKMVKKYQMYENVCKFSFRMLR